MLHYQYTNNNNAETIVFLHGFCENFYIFDNQTQYLKSYFNILCIDLPGFGKSQIINNITLPAMANEVSLVLSSLSINKCFMFGHSMGGYVTLAFVNQFSYKLKGFGLIHSTAKKDSFERLAKRKQLINFIQKHGTAPFYKTFFPDLFYNKELNKSVIEKLINNNLNDKKIGVVEAIKAMMMREENTILLEETELPVFWGIGKHDSIIKDLDMFVQAALCKQAEICYLQNSNHMGMIEEPDILNESILKFVQRIALN